MWHAYHVYVWREGGIMCASVIKPWRSDHREGEHFHYSLVRFRKKVRREEVGFLSSHVFGHSQGVSKQWYSLLGWWTHYLSIEEVEGLYVCHGKHAEVKDSLLKFLLYFTIVGLVRHRESGLVLWAFTWGTILLARWSLLWWIADDRYLII